MSHPKLTVGIDLGDRKSVLCVLGADGEVEKREAVSTTPRALQRVFAALAPARVVLEVGTHSPWISRLLESFGHEVLVANPAALHRKGRSKTDRIDAEQLARWGRADPKLLSPIRHRSEAAQGDLALIRARDALVRTRSALVSHVRGSVKSIGACLPSCSTHTFARAVPDHIPDELWTALSPVLETIGSLTRKIAELDREIERLAEDRHSHSARLRQVTGVGALTALAYVLVLEDPTRFRKSRDVGPYLGLTPRPDESGDRKVERGVGRRGDALLRRLLVSSAHYILGPFGPDTELRRWGLSRMRSGSKGAKKKAVIAVARKLAVLLHRLWVTGERYHPLRDVAQAA
jgi:transposase